MTAKAALVKYHNLEIELLLSHVLNKPKEFLYLHPNHRLTASQARRLSQMVKRREKGEPIAYILGYKDFMGHRFAVNKDVLIPRPETEGLVELALKHIPPQSPLILRGEVSQVPPLRIRGGRGVIRILDLGTGSGCIIISLAKLLPPSFQKRGLGGVSFYASDISKKALAVARQNAREHQVKIKFIHSDILQNVRMSFDIIVANLPYVPSKYYVFHLRQGYGGQASIKYLGWEPKMALVDPVRDLDTYKRFFEQVRGRLNPGGIILMEIDPKSKIKLSAYIKKYLPRNQNAPSVSSWVRGLPASKIKFHKDFNGLWRYVEMKN